MNPKTSTSIRITIAGDKEREFPFGTTVGEIAQAVGRHPCKEACAALLNNRFVDLQKPVEESGTLQFIELDSRDGNRMYERSLSFVLVAALRDVYPDLRVLVLHSLGHGLYCELTAEKYKAVPNRLNLTAEDLRKIEARMRELIAADLPFGREQYSLEEAREIFLRHGHTEKAELIRYHSDPLISLYKLGDYREHFCGYLLPRTGCMRAFELRLYEPGFLLRYPEIGNPDVVPEFLDNPKLFQVFVEYGQWTRILGLGTVVGLNQVVEQNNIADFVRIGEALHEKKIAQIADLIATSPRHPQLVLVAGPSASGKTTFSKRLAVQLRVNGFQPLIIGMDDYFIDREKTPRTLEGEWDFDALEALDVELFSEQMRQLLEGENVPLPHYDFYSGRRMKGQMVCLKKGGIVIVEGIHAFNRNLMRAIPEGLKFKAYVSALTQMSLDSLNRVHTSDTRLIRRLVRDTLSRGYSAVDTIQRWPFVRRGEERNIFPYQEDADVIFNSALLYEYSVLKPYAHQALEKVPVESPAYPEARRLLYLLSYFLPIEIHDIPSTSILREFIGVSGFDREAAREKRKRLNGDGKGKK
jgi:uridine kinase